MEFRRDLWRQKNYRVPWTIVRRCLHDPISRLGSTPTCDRETDR